MRSILSCVLLSLVTGNGIAQTTSKAFEMRYVTTDKKANGETDFKGPTSVFTTEQRIEYLKQYARYAKSFFNDGLLNTKVVGDKEVQDVLGKIKPQPLPSIRKRLPLNSWKYLGYKDGQHLQEATQLLTWKGNNRSITNGRLIFKSGHTFTHQIVKQDWRFFIQFDMLLPAGNASAVFALQDGNGIEVCRIVLKNGKVFYSNESGLRQGISIQPGKLFTTKLELDLENNKYNLYIDNELVADFASTSGGRSVNHFKLSAPKQTMIDNVWGVGYKQAGFTNDTHTRDVPFEIKTFIDEDFEVKPAIGGWQLRNYNDAGWKKADLPYAHGGERYAGEDLYMRKTLNVGNFGKAFLYIETLDPGGEIWINGRVIKVAYQRHPVKIDVSAFIQKNSENLIALRIFPQKVLHTNRHTASDINTGWFAGRAYLDLSTEEYISDVFSYTSSLSSLTNSAVQAVSVTLKNENWQFEEREVSTTRQFKGYISIKAFPWFPNESFVAVAEKKIPVELNLYREVMINELLEIKDPRRWCPEDPQLYKIEVTLQDEENKKLDDQVITAGIRTISQEGGTFRINGKPSMMNGGLLFGYKAPLDKIAQWLRGAPPVELVKELLMVKKMNGNTIRMSIHDGVEGGVNDPRMAEFGDQLGVMFQWTTGTWVRSGTPWNFDWVGLPEYVKQVRNHPSIIMWQVSNHPRFNDFATNAYPWISKVYNIIYPLDSSRLISPAASNARMLYLNDDGTIAVNNRKVAADSFKIWTAPMVTRGDMDFMTGYNSQWDVARSYPHPKNWNGEQGWIRDGFRIDFLNSKHRAYFDFESEESIGQHNWNLMKGKPYYHIMSYELDYDVSSIGRRLDFNEWQESQAWQAFSGYEAYRKKRWLDYDGLIWCTLDGGGNTATYLKPVIDYTGHAKLAFHTVKMAFQKTLAGSNNVDMVYGPADTITPVVMHLGADVLSTVTIRMKDLDGAVLEEKRYEHVALKAGRSLITLPSFIPKVKQAGFYVFEYDVNF